MTTVKVNGLSSLLRATDAAGKETKRLVRDELRKAAEPVRRSAAARFARYDPRSASRYGISVRARGTVSVEQRLRRTTGKRPDFGRLQIEKALGPALEHNVEKVADTMADAVDRICQRWAART